MDGLPELFFQRLKKIIPPDCLQSALESFQINKALSFRINTLKISRQEMVAILNSRKVDFKSISWYPDGIVMVPSTKDKMEDLVQRGLLYQQGLSSMLAPVALAPSFGESVLDLCAAPGSKATMIAALLENSGKILCVEKVRSRMYKLQSVVKLLGATNIEVKLADGRKLFWQKGKDNKRIIKNSSVEPFDFDKILVDAPCSSEGRFHLSRKKTFSYWSLRKIKEMRKKQKGLLLSASRMLRPEGSLIYSTCTFAPEENEEVIQWFLKKTEGKFRVVPLDVKDIRTTSPLLEWGGKVFDKQIENCMRVLPDEKMEGFFIAKIVRQ